MMFSHVKPTSVDEGMNVEKGRRKQTIIKKPKIS